MFNWINKDVGLSVHLLKKHKKKLVNFCNKYSPNECGGILMGHYDESLKKAYIKNIFFSKENVVSRGTVLTEAKKVNILLKVLWRFTLGNCYFIGTWHSHPNGVAIPSQTDDETMIKIAKTNSCNCSRPVSYTHLTLPTKRIV